MSRIGKAPIQIPGKAEVHFEAGVLSVKGGLGKMELTVNPLVGVEISDGYIKFEPKVQTPSAIAFQGTMRALANNMIRGVTEGFQIKLELRGVGYKASVSNNELNLSLGFSHPILYRLPSGVSAETPTPTEIIIRGFNKQVVGQVAAEIRAFRPPEPYKGKGVRYADEVVIIKETKKK